MVPCHLISIKLKSLPWLGPLESVPESITVHLISNELFVQIDIMSTDGNVFNMYVFDLVLAYIKVISYIHINKWCRSILWAPKQLPIWK